MAGGGGGGLGGHIILFPTKQNNVWQNIIAAVYLKVFNLNELLNI